MAVVVVAVVVVVVVTGSGAEVVRKFLRPEEFAVLVFICVD